MNRLFVGDICSVIQYDDSLLTPSDCSFLDSLASEKRRTEQFAWRLLLRHSLHKMGCDESIIAADVVYNEVEAPYLADCEVHIGVSHSASHVAVVIADHPCAVDIELCSRNFTKVQSRFLSTEELTLLSSYDQESFALPLAWSTKETLYKLSGTTELNLVDDLNILAIDSEKRTITGQITRGRFSKTPLTMSYHFDDDHVIVWHV